MAAEPSPDDVLMVVEVTAASRETALRFLRAKNNNVESAISAILDGEDIQAAESASQWDESVWQTPREGQFNMGESIPFEGSIHPLGTSAAPTRGSSPVPSLQRPQTKAEEDEAFQQALAASRGDIAQGEQESGVMTAGTFGPATSSHYDPKQWAMVPSSQNVHETREIVPDAEPNDRRHLEGQPRFLKQLPSGDYLSSLLTILHSIPAAREALLMRSHLQPNYGQDADWWKGHAIKLPRIVSTVTFDSLDPDAQLDDDLINEMQRLIAFLDASFRRYACIDHLTHLASIRAKGASIDSVTDSVLSGWEGAAHRVLGQDSRISSLFHSVVASTNPDTKPTYDMWSLPLTVSEDDRRRPGDITLADLMDDALWHADIANEDLYDTFMDRCAHILPIRISQDNTAQDKLRVIVPAELFVDKYLKENMTSSKALRKEKAAIRRRITKLDAVHQSISSIPHPSGSGFIDATELLKLTRGMLAGEAREAVLAEYEARSVELPTGSLDVPEADRIRNEAIADKLLILSQKISEKLAILEEEKVKSRELLSKISQSVTVGPEEFSQKHRYTLRGVSTKPGVTYILRRKPTQLEPQDNPDDMDTRDDAPRPPQEEPMEDLFADPDADPDAPPGWMWWRIEYDPLQSPVRILETESTQDDVLRAVELEHSSALLVYASDQAMEADEDPQLPEPLQDFVDADNKSFARELNSQWSVPDVSHEVRQSRESWGYGGVTVQTHSRRSSQGSTMVNYDMTDQTGSNVELGAMEDAPAYSFADPPGYSYDPPPYEHIASPEAHEIHLGPDDEGEDMTEAEKAALRGTANRHSVVMGESPPPS